MTHAATAITLVRTFVGDRGLQMKAGCCSLSVLERRTNVDPRLIIGGWKAQKISYGGHLTGGVSREWGFEDVEVEKGRVKHLFLLDCSLNFELIQTSEGCA
jgi:transcription factor C subunit 7